MEKFSSLPVCKRTRQREAEMYRKYHEEIKRKRKLQENTTLASQGTCGKKMNLGKENGICKIVLGNSQDGVLYLGERGNLDFKVKREEIGVDYDLKCSSVDMPGIRRGNVLGQEKEKSSSAPSFGRKKPRAETFSSARREHRYIGVTGDGGVARRTRSHFCLRGNDCQNGVVYGKERKKVDTDIERRVVITISDDENGNDKKSEELKLEAKEEKDEVSSTVDDANVEDDSSDVDNGNEEEDNIDDIYFAYDSSDVDMDEPETSLSSKDGNHKSWEGGGAQDSANSDVIDQDLKVEERKDEEGGSKAVGNNLKDPKEVGKPDSVESNVEKLDCVAMRTRSNSRIEPGMKEVNHGSAKRPGGEGTFEAGKGQVNDDTVRSSCGGKSDVAGKKKKVEHGTVRDRKKRKYRCKIFKNHEFEKILVASILENAKEILPSAPVPKLTEPLLPLKFTFGIEESPSHHKNLEEDEEIVKLWDEMALSLDQNNVNDNQMAENDPDSGCELDIAACCAKGNHHLILDEEIGLVCKYCSHVTVEIRYYVPPMSKNPWGGSERREYIRMLNEIPDDFQYEDVDFDSKSNLNPSPDLHGTVWNLIPGVRRGMHAHQVEGFEFLWKNVAGGIDLDYLKERATSQRGSGCVISHAPGTGKTRLAIAFLQTYMKLYPTCKPIIIAPAGILQTWESEFQKWKVEVPFYNLNDPKLTGKENKVGLQLLKPVNPSLEFIRLMKVLSWKRDGGVLALSYKLFGELTVGERRKSEPRRRTEHGIVWKSLLNLAGLLIIDEGHTPRNSNSVIWKALSRIKTERKIILSGTPFQNNFDELFNILCLVRPTFVRKMTCKRSSAHRGWKFKARAYWDSITGQIEKCDDDRLKLEKLDQVRQMIAPFVHVHKGSILQEKLPGLKDFLVILEPLGMQKDLLTKIDDTLTDRGFNWEQAVSLVCVHPDLLRSKLRKIPGLDVDKRMLESVQLDPEAGAKTKFLLELIRLCDLVGEKVLVFSQYIAPLNLIIKLLGAKLEWVVGREILLIHGQTEPDQRKASIKDFNDPRSSSKIMLASTRACSEGISLVGASRVVLLDVVWNPSVERQAICRAYRLGQERMVHIYHLLASGTREEDKYRRQAEKGRLSELVFYSADSSDCNKRSPSTPSHDKDKLLEQMVAGEKLKHVIKKIVYQSKDCKLVDSFSNDLLEPKV